MADPVRHSVEYYTPLDLHGEVLAGRVRIPPFQRGFKWGANDVVKLFDSLLRGYPIGSLLLWRRPAPAQRLWVGPLEIDAPELDSALWVVDGQQRIFSLVGALNAVESPSDSQFRVHLDLAAGEFHVVGLRQQPPMSWLPVSSLVDLPSLLGWIRANASWLSEQQIALAHRAADMLRDYRVPAYVVTSADEDTVLDIFTRVNSSGHALSSAEIFHALHAGMFAPQAGGLADVGRATAALGFGVLGEQLVLQCVAAVRGGDIFRKDFRDEFAEDEDRTGTVQEAVTAVLEVVDFLRGECGIPHLKLVPYPSVVPLLVRFVRSHGVPSGRIATLLRRWVWRSAAVGVTTHGVGAVEARKYIRAIDAADPFGAVQDLLKHVSSSLRFVTDLDQVHPARVMAKINILALASVGPRDLVTGEPIDVARLVEAGDPLRTIVRDPGPNGHTMANRVIAGPGFGRDLADALAEATPGVAASHLIDNEAQELLSAGPGGQFLIRRAQLVASTVEEYVDRMAEWGARDGRALADVIRSAA